jgi:hypothetical protein
MVEKILNNKWLKIGLLALAGLLLAGGLVWAGMQIGKNSKLKSQKSKLQLKSQNLTPTQTPVVTLTPTFLPENTPLPDETAGWKTYEVDYMSTKTFGFRLKYPSDPKWNISEGKYGVVIANREMNLPDYSPIEHGLFKLDVTILDSGMTAAQWLEEQKKTINSMTGRLDQYLNIRQVAVDSRNGIYYERNDGTMDLASSPGNVVFEAPNNHLVLFESYFDFRNNKITFDQILSTFKFLD